MKKTQLPRIWNLLNEADVVLTHNGKKFDQKKLNAAFALNKLPPVSSYKHIDTCELAKRMFAFTSNKLEYLCGRFCVKYKKLTARKYSGHELWRQCLLGNKDSWIEMEKYNRQDVLALEELYHYLSPWDTRVNFNLYNKDTVNTCKCGSSEIKRNGFYYTDLSKFQRYKCNKCGAETRGRENLFSKKKRKSLQVGTAK